MSSVREAAARFVHADMTVSDKIRALAEAGYPRAEIARLLGKRYQHVRNVLEADRVKQAGLGETKPIAPRSPAKPSQAPSIEARSNGVFRLVVGQDGSVPLPSSVAEAMDAGPGGVLMGRFDGTEFVLISGLELAMRARALFQASMPPGGEGVSLTDELLADRRREVEAERDG